jgi:hypothetical protein
MPTIRGATKFALKARDRFYFGGALWHEHVADIGKTLGAEHFLGHILRGDADAFIFGKADGDRFEGSLGG